MSHFSNLHYCSLFPVRVIWKIHITERAGNLAIVGSIHMCECPCECVCAHVGRGWLVPGICFCLVLVSSCTTETEQQEITFSWFFWMKFYYRYFGLHVAEVKQKLSPFYLLSVFLMLRMILELFLKWCSTVQPLASWVPRGSRAKAAVASDVPFWSLYHSWGCERHGSWTH